MQHILRRLRTWAYSALGKRHIRRDARVEIVAHHNHIEELRLRVYTVRQRGVGRRGQHKWHTCHLHQVGSVTAASALGVIGVYRATINGCDGILHIAALVERVGVDSHLHIVSLRNIHSRAYRLGCRAPILVNLQSAGTRHYLLLDRFTARAVTLAQKADIHRHCLRRLKHLLDIPHARGDGRTI